MEKENMKEKGKGGKGQLPYKIIYYENTFDSFVFLSKL